MSTVVNSVSDFVDMALQLFPPFRWDEEQENTYGAIMARELGGFSPAVLDRAFSELVRARKKDTRTPSPGECLSFCIEARRWLEMESNTQQLPQLRASSDEWSRERRKLAHDLKRSDLGRQAAREGWIVALWNFCRRNQRLPSGREIDQCKRDSEGIEEIYNRAMRGGCGPLSAKIAKFAEGLLEQRKNWSEEVLGK